MALRSTAVVLAAGMAAAPTVGWAHVPEAQAVGGRDHPEHVAQVSADMATAAAALLAALSPVQQGQVRIAFDDPERQNWHAIPRPRKGVPIRELSPAQRNLVWALLTTGLSHRGFTRAQQIISLEDILKTLEPTPAGKAWRDPELYYVTLFGDPGPNGVWGWRFEGHHLSINYTLVDGKVITGAPTFLGSNPFEVQDGPRKGLRPLGDDDAAGLRLVLSLTDEQRLKAVFAGPAPDDILTFGARRVDKGKVEALGPGIAARDLTAGQREMLLSLIEDYARRHRPGIADAELRRIHVAGFDKVSFLWAGGTDGRSGRYYRVMGPTFLIEYDNVQQNANHVHSVWRDADNDFGEDLLKRHYETAPHHRRVGAGRSD